MILSTTHKTGSPLRLRARLSAVGAVLLLLTVSAAAAQDTERARTEALSRRAADRIKVLREEADRLASEAGTVLGELRALEIERQIRTEQVREAERAVTASTEELAALDAEIATLTAETRAEVPGLRARMVSLYKLGQGRYLRLLLSTSDLTRLGQASRMVAVLASQDRERAAQHVRRLQELSASRTALAERQARLATLRLDAERAKAEADRAVTARNARIRQIDQRRDLNAQLAGELVSAHQKLQTQLANLDTGTTAANAALPIGPFKGDLEWPVAGRLRQGFGVSGNGRPSASTGIDLAAAEGTPVRAIHDGRVAFADVFTGFGRLVIVDHGAQAFSLYGNLADITVAPGSQILRGATIGSVGVGVTGAEGLYFELRVDGRPVDPIQWLRKR